MTDFGEIWNDKGGYIYDDCFFNARLLGNERKRYTM